MYAEANRLVELQRRERGTEVIELGGKKVRVPGPYEPTEEREERARKILDLRRRAARMEYPLVGRAG